MSKEAPKLTVLKPGDSRRPSGRYVSGPYVMDAEPADEPKETQDRHIPKYKTKNPGAGLATSLWGRYQEVKPPMPVWANPDRVMPPMEADYWPMANVAALFQRGRFLDSEHWQQVAGRAKVMGVDGDLLRIAYGQ